MKRWLTVTEAARLLEIDPRTVRRWCSRGVVPAERVGVRLWKIRTSVLRRRFPGVMNDLDAAYATGDLLRAHASLSLQVEIIGHIGRGSPATCMGRRRSIDEAGAFHTERPSTPNAHGFDLGDDAAGRWLKANDRSLRASAAAKARHAKRPARVSAAGGAA